MGRDIVTESKRLADALQRFRSAQSADVDQAPGCVFGLLTRDGLDDLRNEMDRLTKSVENLNKVLLGLLISIVLSALGLLISGVVS